MMNRRWTLGLLFAGSLIGLAACTGPAGSPGAKGDPGPAGTNGTSCSVAQFDGGVTVTCPGSNPVTVTNGSSGQDCTVVPFDGGVTVNCPGSDPVTVTNGTNGTNGANGDAGRPGLSAGQTPGLIAAVAAAAPANGTHFAVGERIAITITVTDGSGNPVAPSQLAQARLMISGPKKMANTVTAVGLMNVSGDRDAGVHDYVPLNGTTANPNLAVNGNVMTFTTQAVSTEAPGTYTIAFWATSAAYPLDQVFTNQDVQIGTATVEARLVTKEKCAACHQGASSGKFYLHHTQVSAFAPVGNWAIDNDPVNNCKTCHNQDGYAAYCDDRTLAACTPNHQVSDPIVRRVHGVHMGARLRSPFDTSPVNGDFKDYTSVVFPSNVRTCTTCHVDDRWKTTPSREACGACHDAIDWTTGAISPAKDLGRPAGAACTTDASCTAVFAAPATCDLTTTSPTFGHCVRSSHGGLAQANDATCTTCHPADGAVSSASVPTSTIHAVAGPAFQYDVGLQLSAPANGQYYTGSEAPALTITVTPVGTTTAIDPATITEATFKRANLYVSGPRVQTRPVLTTAAHGMEAEATSAAGPFNLSAATDLQLRIDLGGPLMTIPVSAGTFATPTAATAAEVVAWLNANGGFSAVATALTRGPKVVIQSNTRTPSQSTAAVEIDPSTAGVALGLIGATATSPNVSRPLAYAENVLSVRLNPADEDPKLTRDSTNRRMTYTLDPVTGLAPGTYSVWVEVGSTFPVSWALLNFQVGTATVQDKEATNCLDCHANTRMHDGYFSVVFDTDICKSCHDYNRQNAGAMGWGPGNNYGFGSAPIARRVHGVHRGKYLSKPGEIVPAVVADYSGVIFPQDVRNCSKCHSTTNTNWKDNPSRLACLACHDSDAAITHASLNTFDPSPADPWSGDEQETCSICHSGTAAFSVEVVHNVATPYKPPYRR